MAEASEADQFVALTPIQRSHFGYALSNGEQAKDLRALQAVCFRGQHAQPVSYGANAHRAPPLLLCPVQR